jgi:hypothetical protein
VLKKESCLKQTLSVSFKLKGIAFSAGID